MTDFCLDSKWQVLEKPTKNGGLIAYPLEDVKEFIKRLKEKCTWEYGEVVSDNWVKNVIDKLAGEKLTK